MGMGMIILSRQKYLLRISSEVDVGMATREVQQQYVRISRFLPCHLRHQSLPLFQPERVSTPPPNLNRTRPRPAKEKSVVTLPRTFAAAPHHEILLFVMRASESAVVASRRGVLYVLLVLYVCTFVLVQYSISSILQPATWPGHLSAENPWTMAMPAVYLLVLLHIRLSHLRSYLRVHVHLTAPAISVLPMLMLMLKLPTNDRS